MYNFESVTELDDYINEVAIKDNRLCNFSVIGEISGFKKYPSGHCYFTLKDADSQISAVMFKYAANSLGFVPADGLQVIAAGRLGFYGSNGKLQIYVGSMNLVGQGDLREQFDLLFSKLNEEGLFSNEHKKKIPVLPRKIGIITSPQGAVIHDIVTTLKRRNPYFDITIYPASVQGEQCPSDFCKGIEYFSNNPVDVIILARGGGSYEDLFGFNDEILARTIYSCEIPIISAIGHQIDMHICDFVSDLSVATPTAAAEQVMPSYEDINYTITNMSISLDLSIEGYINSRRSYIETLSNHKALSAPTYYVDKQIDRIKGIEKSLSFIGSRMYAENSNKLKDDSSKLNTLFEKNVNDKKFELKLFTEKLDTLGPLNVLKRGFSYITDEKTGVTVKSVSELKKGTHVSLVLKDGACQAEII